MCIRDRVNAATITWPIGLDTTGSGPISASSLSRRLLMRSSARVRSSEFAFWSIALPHADATLGEMRPLFKQVARRGFRDGSLWEKAPPGWYIGTASPEMTMYRFTAEDGASLAYRDEGAGLPLLCLPGLTRSMADFDYLIPHLPPVRLIRMDYRGRGASDRTGAATYTVDQEGRDALALLSHLGVQKAAILGTSRGGLIGMVLGAVARDRVLGLCLNDVGPEIARDGLTRIFD